MTEEERQLLFKDLCARLPYGVKVKNKIGQIQILSLGNADLARLFYEDSSITIKNLSLPLLRPMSSMTEEELNELRNYTGLLYDNLDLASFQNGAYKCLDFYLSEIPADVVIKVFDWLNSHHFDYRGLISMGLALEAPKEIYENKSIY